MSIEGKIHPKLRMFANCESPINQVRAEQVSILMVPSGNLDASVPSLRGEGVVPARLSSRERPPKPNPNFVPDRKTLVNVYVDLRHGTAAPLKGEKSRVGNLVLVEASVADAPKLADDPAVAMVTPAEALKFADPTRTRPSREKPASRKPRVPRSATQGSVLLGVIDVQGFDFSHPDFVYSNGAGGAAKTRFVRIWDQGGEMRPPPTFTGPMGVPRFAYGSEITGAHMEAALANSAAAKIPARDLEPQSQMRAGSHGTHVAGTAAGRFGVCPEALIAGVLISLPDSDLDRRKSFYDSSRLVDALEYLISVAEELGRQRDAGTPLPLSINISLGTNGDAHDGSSPVCRWIESALATASRCVCVAAGNAGQSAPTEPGDIGYVLGRIHTAGKVAAKGLETRLEWTVVGNGRADLSENELEIWYSPQDRFRVSLLPPGSTEWIGPVDERQYIQNKQLPDGTFVSIYNEVYHPMNGANQIAVYLSPNLTPGNLIGIAAGVWTVRLEGVDVRDGRFDGWIERDDPVPLGRLGEREAWRFPSFFTEKSSVPVGQVSSLACSPRIVSVANLDTKRGRIHVSSSQGPTRDGRFKPDVAAAGTDVLASNGFGDLKSPTWISMTGTSMASPYVAGVAAMMLSIAPRLNAAQINGILQRTARPLPGKTYEWATDAGFGIIDADACLAEAIAVNTRNPLS